MADDGPRVVSWTMPSADLPRALRQLGPSDGMLALYGPDAARLVDRQRGDADLDDAGRGWTFGRAFGHHREVLWRSEGDLAVVVLVSVPGDTQLVVELPAGSGQPMPGSTGWQRRAQDSDHAVIMLWSRDDRQVGEPDYPAGLAQSSSPELAVEEWQWPEGGVAWRRYLPLDAPLDISLDEVRG